MSLQTFQTPNIRGVVVIRNTTIDELDVFYGFVVESMFEIHLALVIVAMVT